MQSPPSWCRNVRPYYNSDGFVVSANGESIGPLGIHSRFCDRHHFRDGNGCQRAMEVLLSLFPRIETALTKYGLYRTFVLYSVSRDKRYYPVLDQSSGHLNKSCVEMTVNPCRNGSIAGGNSCESF
jgi:hypothetical protein